LCRFSRSLRITHESGVQASVRRRGRNRVVIVVIVAIVRRLLQIGRRDQHGRGGDSGRRTAGHAATGATATAVAVGCNRPPAPRLHQRRPAGGRVCDGQRGRAHRVAESSHVLAGLRSVAQRAG